MEGGHGVDKPVERREEVKPGDSKDTTEIVVALWLGADQLMEESNYNNNKIDHRLTLMANRLSTMVAPFHSDLRPRSE